MPLCQNYINFATPIIIMTTIILPTKNEALSIAHTIEIIRKVCSEEIVVVDGWSTDSTQYIARYECNVPVVVGARVPDSGWRSVG
jgi:glycosyltransferase involved in cell wall biosynthesis